MPKYDYAAAVVVVVGVRLLHPPRPQSPNLHCATLQTPFPSRPKHVLRNQSAALARTPRPHASRPTRPPRSARSLGCALLVRTALTSLTPPPIPSTRSSGCAHLNLLRSPPPPSTPLALLVPLASFAPLHSTPQAVITTIFGPKEGVKAAKLIVNCTTPAETASAAAAIFANSTNATRNAALYKETEVYFTELFAERAFIGYETTVMLLFVISLVVMRLEPKAVEKYLFLFYSYVAGTLGGQQNLFLKGVASLLGLAFGDVANGQDPIGDAVFGDWMVWIFIIGMLILAPSQLAVINGESPCAERAKRAKGGGGQGGERTWLWWRGQAAARGRGKGGGGVVCVC